MQKVLFLCTGNSARSILAEAILNRVGKGRFKAYSAGSQPKSEPNPYALELLRRQGYGLSSYRSKSWDEFSDDLNGKKMHHIITVCDNAAGESCPLWPGKPASGHWGIPDPAAATGDERDIELAFLTAYAQLSDRIGRFVSMPIEDMKKKEIRELMEEIGSFSGATGGIR
ncbi:MAG: arsenate reductase ArsC [Cohaesibacter sp.]|jgi:arsenate reductase|nr:arsenate reductase ArsC [Cohaesibacter sp.]